MSTGELIVVAIRVLVPLLILRWPLQGAIAALLADSLDVVLIELIGLGGFGAHYSQLDKALDTYYLTLLAYVALRWESPCARVTALALYGYRLVGVILFEVTHVRWLLLVFPNMFENWWFYCAITLRFFPRVHPRSALATVVPFVALLIPKLFQEWLLHYEKAQPWDWIKRNVLGTS